MKTIRLSLTITLLLAAQIVPAQQAADSAIAPADLAIPDSPAFTVLGISPDKVTRPATLTAFAAAAANGIDDHGRIHNGVAIDVNPMRAFFGNRLTLENFNVAARTSLSIATTQETSGNVGHVALGVHTAIFDRGDPHGDKGLIECFQKALTDVEPAVSVDGKPTDVKSLTELVAKCRADAASAKWNRGAWIVAVAPAWISSDATLQKLESDGGGAWTSLAWGFENLCPDPKKCDGWRGHLYRNAQIVGHARARNNEHVTDKNKVTTDHDRRLYGARLRVGTANLNGSIELTRESDRTKADRKRRNAVVFAFEQRLAEGVWLNLALGREQKSDTSNGVVARSTFHWQFNPKMKLR